MNINLDKIAVPIGVRENLEFRMKLHSLLSKDEGAQKDYIALLKINPVLAYDTLFWTHNPRKPIGEMNLPFIVSARPSQVRAINKIKEVNWMGDIGINKSRDEGATELLMKYITLMLLFTPDVSFLIGSRSEDLVDKSGDPGTLFAKIDYAIKYLPMWLTKRLHIDRTFKHIENLDIASTVNGEATNENFGAGKRATAVVLDEFGRVIPNIAQSIEDTVKDITNCVIYNSTHWFGTGHSFAKILKKPNVTVITLPWYENPEKNQGLYHSESKTEWPMDFRSPWFDAEVPRRTRRDVMMNLWMCPEGASDQFFDSVVNEQVREKMVKNPAFQGDIIYEIKDKKPTPGLFINGNNHSFRWWGTLARDLSFEKFYLLKYNKKVEIVRPNQEHNYIVGCDIGFGTGASNSTAMITDANTGEQIGEYVCSDKSPEQFADLVTALCWWIGGVRNPFLIWERTGGQGINFGRRVLENGYTNVYTKTTEQTKTRRRQNVYGWDNIGGPNGTKQDMLTQLQIAIKESLNKVHEHKFIIIRSGEVVNELDGYIFYPSGELDSSEVVDETSGARRRHGDRVIGIGLCVLGMLDCAKGTIKTGNKVEFNSLAWRMAERKREDAMKKETWGEKSKNSMRGWK